MNKLIVIITISFLVSCNRVPSGVRDVLDLAGDNRIELEKVIRHYQETGEKEKLKAAYFLIENMQYNYSNDGDEIKKFDKIFDILDSLYNSNIKGKDLVQTEWDSLVNIYGTPRIRKSKVLPDYISVKADFLMENIEWAFKMRDLTAWGKNINFEDFCNYILPYRLGTERLENWRPHFYEKVTEQRDTTTAQTRLEYARVLNNVINKYVETKKTFWSYPFDMRLSDIEKGKLGACKHQVHYTALMMRANGLPVGMDYTPRWGNKKNGHEWNIILKDDGKFYPFDASKTSFSVEYDHDRFVAKVFRKTFVPYLKEIPLPLSDELPPDFYDFNRRDVTQEYKKVVDLKIPMIYPAETPKEYAVICTFDNKGWSPQYFGKIKGNTATFKKMGVGNIYIAMYYKKGRLTQASDPFILDTLGKIIPLEANENHRQDMLLLRKYPLTDFFMERMGWSVGCRFEGANDTLFSHPIVYNKINKLPVNVETVYVNNSNTTRYVRFVSDKKTGEHAANIAEIEFYGLDKNNKDTIKLNGRLICSKSFSEKDKTEMSKLFDNDLLSYFELVSEKLSWIGFDLGKATKIVKIRYCPRSDVNFIVPGHNYELCYWLKGRWLSLGKQIAIDQYIKYRNIPSEGLYLLHDYTTGEEERVFTYENNKQIFW